MRERQHPCIVSVLRRRAAGLVTAFGHKTNRFLNWFIRALSVRSECLTERYTTVVIYR
jgi:hypothetical protein